MSADDGLTATTRGAPSVGSGLLMFVPVTSVALVFMDAVWLPLDAAIGPFLVLGWRWFSYGIRVPLMSVEALVVVLARDAPTLILLEAVGLGPISCRRYHAAWYIAVCGAEGARGGGSRGLSDSTTTVAPLFRLVIRGAFVRSVDQFRRACHPEGSRETCITR